MVRFRAGTGMVLLRVLRLLEDKLQNEKLLRDLPDCRCEFMIGLRYRYFSKLWILCGCF